MNKNKTVKVQISREKITKYLNWPSPNEAFHESETNEEANNTNEHNMIKNPNW